MLSTYDEDDSTDPLPELPIDPDIDVGDAGDADHKPLKLATILLLIGSAGALGALARYALGRLLPVSENGFPLSTLLINVSGSLVIGVVLILLNDRFTRTRFARPLLVTGFLGAYTTFSTYVVEADLLFRQHDLATGIAYILVSLVAGLAAVVVGVRLGRFVGRIDGKKP